MAEDKRANPYPITTAAEAEAAPGSREQKAARNVAVRQFGGIPRRAFLLGDNDHSPVLRGIVDLATAAYKLADAIDAANLNGHVRELPTAEEWGRIIDANAELVAMMEDHGCPG